MLNAIEEIWAADDAVIIAMYRNPFMTMEDIKSVVPLPELTIREIIEAYRSNGWRNPRTNR